MNLDKITVRIDGSRIAIDAKGAGDRVFVTLLIDPTTARAVANGITDLLTEMQVYADGGPLGPLTNSSVAAEH